MRLTTDTCSKLLCSGSRCDGDAASAGYSLGHAKIQTVLYQFCSFKVTKVQTVCAHTWVILPKQELFMQFFAELLQYCLDILLCKQGHCLPPMCKM